MVFVSCGRGGRRPSGQPLSAPASQRRSLRHNRMMYLPAPPVLQTGKSNYLRSVEMTRMTIDLARLLVKDRPAGDEQRRRRETTEEGASTAVHIPRQRSGSWLERRRVQRDEGQVPPGE